VSLVADDGQSAFHVEPLPFPVTAREAKQSLSEAWRLLRCARNDSGLIVSQFDLIAKLL